MREVLNETRRGRRQPRQHDGIGSLAHIYRKYGSSWDSTNRLATTGQLSIARSRTSAPLQHASPDHTVRAAPVGSSCPIAVHLSSSPQPDEEASSVRSDHPWQGDRPQRCPTGRRPMGKGAGTHRQGLVGVDQRHRGRQRGVRARPLRIRGIRCPAVGDRCAVSSRQWAGSRWVDCLPSSPRTTNGTHCCSRRSAASPTSMPATPSGGTPT